MLANHSFIHLFLLLILAHHHHDYRFICILFYYLLLFMSLNRIVYVCPNVMIIIRLEILELLVLLFMMQILFEIIPPFILNTFN